MGYMLGMKTGSAAVAMNRIIAITSIAFRRDVPLGVPSAMMEQVIAPKKITRTAQTSGRLKRSLINIYPSAGTIITAPMVAIRSMSIVSFPQIKPRLTYRAKEVWWWLVYLFALTRQTIAATISETAVIAINRVTIFKMGVVGGVRLRNSAISTRWVKL